MIFKRSKVHKIIQDRKTRNKNKVAVECLREIGFSDVAIRGGLMKMNGITVPDLLKNNPGLKPPTLYGTLQGRRPNIIAKQVTANALGLDIDEFYPRGETLQ